MLVCRDIMATGVDRGVAEAEAASAAGAAPAVEGADGAGVAVEQSLSINVAGLHLDSQAMGQRGCRDSSHWYVCIGDSYSSRAASCGL